MTFIKNQLRYLLAGFVFWSDSGHYNVIGNENGAEFMTCPEIVTLE